LKTGSVEGRLVRDGDDPTRELARVHPRLDVARHRVCGRGAHLEDLRSQRRDVDHVPLDAAHLDRVADAEDPS
jgi:hypothetical protein